MTYLEYLEIKLNNKIKKDSSIMQDYSFISYVNRFSNTAAILKGYIKTKPVIYDFIVALVCRGTTLSQAIATALSYVNQGLIPTPQGAGSMTPGYYLNIDIPVWALCKITREDIPGLNWLY